MNFKFRVFQTITYRSILSQTYSNYLWLIYTSTLLPHYYKSRLEQITNDRIKVAYVRNFEEFDQEVEMELREQKGTYATTRLDDDDGLDTQFLQNLNRYGDKQGSIISYPMGAEFTLASDRDIIKGRQVKLPKIACGLTALGMNIYSCGNHSHVDRAYPVIYDWKPDSYLLCCSDYGDSKRKFSPRE